MFFKAKIKMCAKFKFSQICNYLISTFSKIWQLLHFGKIPKHVGQHWAKFSRKSATFWQLLQHFFEKSAKLAWGPSEACLRQYRPSHTYVLSDFDTLLSIFRDILASVPHVFMIFVFFFHPSRTDAAALQFLLLADARKFLDHAARDATSEFFLLGFSSHSLDFPRNFLKFLSRLSPKFLEILVLFVPHTREL